MKKAVILANGEFPQCSELRGLLATCPLLICCDGAYDKLVASKIETTGRVLVIGDGDSLHFRLEGDAQFIDGYVEQETNDLSKAVRFALTLGVDEVEIVGATGLREDHTIGNIGHLADFSLLRTASDKLLKVSMVSDYGRFTPVVGSGTLRSFPRQQVSFFCMRAGVPISVSNMLYPIEHRCFDTWWGATLNEAAGSDFTVRIEGDGVVLVYQTHDAK